MAKGFVRGMLQLLIWPLFRPSRWRAAMAALDLAPGLALVDLSMRRVDHRRLAAQVCSLWLCAVAWNAMYSIQPISLALGAIAELEMPVLAFLSMLAIGGSVPGAIALLFLWQVVSLVLPPYIFNIHGMGALPMRPILIVASITAFGFGGLRYGRNATVVRQLISLLAAPFLMIVAWLPIPALVNAWQIGLNLAVDIALMVVLHPASSSPGLDSGATKDIWANTLNQYVAFEGMLAEMCLGFPIIMVLLVLPLMRDLTTRVWAWTRSGRGGPRSSISQGNN
jgi:hypothetical protein